MNMHPLQPRVSGRHRRRRRHRSSTHRLRVALFATLAVMVLAVVALGVEAWLVEDGQRPAPAHGSRPLSSFFK